MKTLKFQVEFLSDIVLPASSNTEGNIRELDFIPGSNFLGMVAKKYEKFEKSFDIFHSGKVRFGDATILHDEKITYKMPLSYFHKKLDNETVFNHHFLNDSDFKKLGQLKQKRSGYITEDLEKVEIDYNYSQKSAYDKKNRRSLDSSMFGYSAIKSGTKWQFSIKYDDISEKDLELLKDSITGTQRLGKSKSSQYGLVEITSLKDNELDLPKEIQTENRVVLYANSRLALVDESGNPTYDLKYLFDGLNEKDIDYPKCQIKTSTFTPYNGAMQTKTYERVCIDRGSVIVLKEFDKEKVKLLVGAYQSEGFGELLLNPSFLSEKVFHFKESDNENKNEEKQAIESDLAKFLKQREDKQLDKLNILKDVDEFISKYYKSVYEKIKPSQWGKIRSICTSAQDDFKEEIREYISNGTKKWEQNQIDTLLSNDYTLEFIMLISIQMPKQKEQKNEN